MNIIAGTETARHLAADVSNFNSDVNAINKCHYHRRRRTMLESLPEELFIHILDYLPLSSICQLGATNLHLYQRIHQNENFWTRRLRFELKIIHDYHEDFGALDEDINAVISDPTASTSKEVYLMYSKEFQRKNSILLKKKTNLGKGFVDHLFSYFWNETTEKSNNVKRLAFFGPGIESRRSKKFIFKMINAHNNCLNATSFVPGLPGGVGSGIRIEFDGRLYTFDLICLYTNTFPLRQTFQGQQRLEASNNRLLKRDYRDHEKDQSGLLNDSLCQLLPTLDGFVFAVDIHEPMDEKSAVQKELIMIMNSDFKPNQQKPLLILCCAENESTFRHFCIDQFTGRFQRLRQMERPWGVFKVNTSTMFGLDAALHWILYNCQKESLIN